MLVTRCLATAHKDVYLGYIKFPAETKFNKKLIKSYFSLTLLVLKLE